MGALQSEMRSKIEGGKPRSAKAAVVPLHGVGEVPDWLAAIGIPAAIWCVAGDELIIETYNAAFGERELEKARRWLAENVRCRSENYIRILDFVQSDRPSEMLELHRDDPLNPRHISYTLGRLASRADGTARFLTTQIDRTSERQTENNLRRELVSDSLTGLPNRTGFGERIDARLADPDLPPVSQYAIMALDVMRFSRVNESLGAIAGDELIITVARRLKSCLREGDILARLGGNEFGIFARLNNGLADALHIVERLNASVAAPCRLSDLQISIDVAIGCSISNPDHDSDDILRQAQAAMKMAKSSGKLEIYRPGVLRQARDRFNLESKLRDALADGGLSMAYHPLIDLKSGAVIGFEALARWCDPERGEISPVEFIPVAEESGLIAPLGRWGMHEALQTLAQWDRQYGEVLPLGVNVNLSPIQMARDDVPAVVEEALRYSGISGERLTVELTESAIIADPEKARQVLTALKVQKLSVAMDDFGTGFSNLASLHRLPIDILKIDRSFISDMLADEEKGAIVRAILSLASSLKLKTTAEGVESEALVAALTDHGCMHGQGFHFAQPMTAEQAYSYWLSRKGA